jgi:mutator protein MutT
MGMTPTPSGSDTGGAIPIAIAVVEHENRFLIARRPSGVELAGFWEFPGGKVHEGESVAEAAARECWEETTLEVEVLGSYGERLYSYDHGAVHLHFLACRPCDPSQPPCLPFRWVEREDLNRHRFPPANDELLKRLLQ